MPSRCGPRRLRSVRPPSRSGSARVPRRRTTPHRACGHGVGARARQARRESPEARPGAPRDIGRRGASRSERATASSSWARSSACVSCVLRAHRSFSSKKTMSPGRFEALLRYQLDVSEEQFWRALETRKPVDRRARRRPAPGRVPEARRARRLPDPRRRPPRRVRGRRYRAIGDRRSHRPPPRGLPPLTRALLPRPEPVARVETDPELRSPAGPAGRTSALHVVGEGAS